MSLNGAKNFADSALFLLQLSVIPSRSIFWMRLRAVRPFHAKTTFSNTHISAVWFAVIVT